MSERAGPEWGTLTLIIACYGAWLAALFFFPVWAAVPLVGVIAALHSSLTHEAIHGHPFRQKALNEALMALPLTLFIPYRRFRDQHLAHHRDATLTDPYDDPESNYLDPQVWAGLRGWQKRLLAVNNTLLGRIVLGPTIGQFVFMRNELRCVFKSEILRAWVFHLCGVLVVLWIVSLSPMPIWAYVLAAYLGLGLVKIRTFLEHRAHDRASARTVIIEDRGPLAFLFLHNNLHVVHHMNPAAPWYRLPALYRAGQDTYLARNEAYVYRSYAQVFRAHFLRAKDPVPHPLWPKG